MISRWNHNVETELGELSFIERPKSFSLMISDSTWFPISENSPESGHLIGYFRLFFGSRMKLEFEGAPEIIQWPCKTKITITYTTYDRKL